MKLFYTKLTTTYNRSEIENIRGVQMGRGSIDHLMELDGSNHLEEKIYQVNHSMGYYKLLWTFGIENISDLNGKMSLKQVV